MEDSLNYMNAVSEASQALNQVNALKQEAEMQFQQKKEQLGQALELPSEISFTTAGGYIGKKVLGYVSEKFGSTITEAASKVGISEETVGKALSGDISGAIEQGTQEVTGALEGAVGQAQQMVSEGLGEAVGQAQGMISEGLGEAVGQAQGLVGGMVEEGSSILGRFASGLENIPSITPSSIMPEIDVGNIYNQGLDDLKAQMGIDDASFREYTNISLNDMKPFGFNNPPPAEVEMTDFSTIGTPSTNGPAEALGTSTAEEATAEATTTGAEAGAETGVEAGAAVAETAGEVAGAEAAGAALDATGVLAPIGALVGLIGGLVGFFEGRKEESETMPVVPTPILNPSTQFL